MDEENRGSSMEDSSKKEDPLEALMKHNLDKISVMVSDGLVEPEHIEDRFGSDKQIVDLGSSILDWGGYAKLIKYDISKDPESPDKYSVNTVIQFSGKAAERSDKGYFAAHRRNQVQRLLESQGYMVVPYDQEVNNTGIKRYGLHISKDSVKYDLHFGYQTETDAVAAAVSKRRRTQMEAGKTRNQMITMSSEPAELDEKGKYVQGCANTAKDFLSAILTESGEKVDNKIDIVFR